MTLTDEILSSLCIADKTGAWGTLGTIRPLKSFDIESALDKIAETLETKGNRQTIIDVVTSLNNDQRQQVIQLYNASTNQDLVVKIQKYLSGDLEKTIVGLLKTPASYDAQELQASMKGLGTDEATLSEILCTRSNEQLKEIQEIYRKEYKADLEKDIISDTSEPCTSLLLGLAMGKREKDAGITDYGLINQDCKLLSELGPKNSPNTEQWIKILTERSPSHLRKVFDQYNWTHSVDIEETIKKQFKGDFQKTAITLVSVMRNMPLYFADKLFNATKLELIHFDQTGASPPLTTDVSFPERTGIFGLGTDQKTISRILISRSETDLISIRVEYRKKYGKSLYSSIQSELKGELQSCLLFVCRAEDL